MKNNKLRQYQTWYYASYDENELCIYRILITKIETNTIYYTMFFNNGTKIYYMISYKGFRNYYGKSIKRAINLELLRLRNKT